MTERFSPLPPLLLYSPGPGRPIRVICDCYGACQRGTADPGTADRLYGAVGQLLSLAAGNSFLSGNLWQQSLTYHLTHSLNPFSLACEGRGDVGGSLSQAALADRKATWGGVKDWAKTTVTDPIGAQTEGMWAQARADSRAALADHKTAWGGIKDWVKTYVTDPVGELFGDMWAQAKADTKAGVKQVVDNVSKLPGLLSEKLSGLKEAVSQGSGSGVEILRPPVSPGGLAGAGALPLPLLLPGLASGGVVREPTVAQIGESGPEAVVPLSQDAGWLDALAERLERRGTGWGGSLTIPVYVGGRKVTETVIRDVNEIIRSTGECPIHI